MRDKLNGLALLCRRYRVPAKAAPVWLQSPFDDRGNNSDNVVVRCFAVTLECHWIGHASAHKLRQRLAVA